IFSIVQLTAQGASASVPVRPSNPADEIWSTLRNIGQSQRVPEPIDTVPESGEQGRQSSVARLISDADKLEKFRAEHPAHSAVGEAHSASASDTVTTVTIAYRDDLDYSMSNRPSAIKHAD